ncbi:hypothetical protein EJB05_44959, partial [Eragrostis curvula]
MAALDEKEASLQETFTKLEGQITDLSTKLDKLDDMKKQLAAIETKQANDAKTFEFLHVKVNLSMQSIAQVQSEQSQVVRTLKILNTGSDGIMGSRPPLHPTQPTRSQPQVSFPHSPHVIDPGGSVGLSGVASGSVRKTRFLLSAALSPLPSLLSYSEFSYVVFLDCSGRLGHHILRLQRDGGLQIPLTMDTVKGVIIDLFAGSNDTSATTLQWAMAELMRNPSVMSRLQHEVRGAFAATNKVSEEGLRELSYLHLVIKETLRLHLPSPLLVPRVCQEQCQILGYDVPKGTMVMVNAGAMSTDPEYWDEPEAFRPERFQDGDKDFKGNDFDFMSFGGCANIELALATLVFYFDWSMPEGVTCTKLDMTEAAGITVRIKKSDLWLRATPHNGWEKLYNPPRIWWCKSWYAVLFQKNRWNKFHGSIRPQWSSMAFTVQKEKK